MAVEELFLSIANVFINLFVRQFMFFVSVTRIGYI